MGYTEFTTDDKYGEAQRLCLSAGDFVIVSAALTQINDEADPHAPISVDVRHTVMTLKLRAFERDHFIGETIEGDVYMVPWRVARAWRRADRSAS